MYTCLSVISCVDSDPLSPRLKVIFQHSDSHPFRVAQYMIRFELILSMIDKQGLEVELFRFGYKKEILIYGTPTMSKLFVEVEQLYRCQFFSVFFDVNHIYLP